ncbi:tryptophan 2,3-dioxygenase [Amycolatopsis silviterrae]|uniref:Tryptophan 2,3-dioxygenase n=1 Tax=Amycolatopsis silviterrae TaxID=1656914 RepID=A0ABW5H2K2_9PSEU
MTAKKMAQGPRAYIPLTEDERRERAEHSGGEPVFDFRSGAAGPDSTAYVDYHSVDALLSLQHPRTGEPAELAFYTVGQVQELLFKLLFTEANRVRDLLFDDRLDDALWCLRRMERTQRVLVASWEPVSTITAAEFAAFRDQLGVASGIQSHMYRQLEFALGNKSPRMAEAYEGISQLHKDVDAALRAPSMYDGALALLRRRGAPIPEDHVTRDFAQPYQPHPAVEEAWAGIYRDPAGQRDLYVFAEALSDVNHQYSLWRSAHLLTVERVLGSKPGSGGTAGVAWLRRVAEHRFFPELLSARTAL